MRNRRPSPPAPRRRDGTATAAAAAREFETLAKRFVEASRRGDYALAGQAAEAALRLQPGHPGVMADHALALMRQKRHAEAHALYLRVYQAHGGRPAPGSTWLDGLAEACGWLGLDAESRRYGHEALTLADQRLRQGPAQPLPPGPPPPFDPARPEANVIAFTLFGDNPRYGESAVMNVRAAAELFPHWRCRIYLDDSVPPDVQRRLREAGGRLVDMTGSAGLHPLMWRFLVADDPTVARFLVRDADSLLSEREQGAVAEWLASGRWFHHMRDYFTHTELILAGLWGGCHGALPAIEPLMRDWLAAERDLTRFADQIFLRERVWPTLRQSVLCHDERFGFHDARPFPAHAPIRWQTRAFHVGSNASFRCIEGTNRVGTAETNITALQGDVSTAKTNITNLQGDVATNSTSITNLTTTLNNGSVGLVRQDATTQAITVAADKAGTTMSIAGTAGARTLSGVAAGSLAAASTEAVNGSQLFATNTRVGTAESSITTLQGDVSTAKTNITTLQGDVATNQSSINSLTTTINNGGVGLVQQDATTNAITVAGDKAGASVNFAGTAGARTLSGVAAGSLAAASTEAVNGSQLFATNTRVGTAETNITALQGDVATNQSNISSLTTTINNGGVGLVQQDATTNAITVAGDKAGASVNFAGTAGARTLSGVANGQAGTDAVNVRQLQSAGVLDSNGNALDVLSYDAGSSKSRITLGGAGGTQIKNVADGTDNGDAVNLGQLKKTGLVDGSGNTLDAVTYDAGSRTRVTFGDVGAPVVLSNVAAGAAATEAVNVGQLRGVVSALGGGADIDASGKVIAPTYTVNNASYNSVNDALQGLAGTIDQNGNRLTVVEKITNNGSGNSQLATSGGSGNAAIASGKDAVAIGSGANASADNSVALGANSVADRANTVSVGSVGNERAIANLADAVNATDAVNKRQLDAVSDGARTYTDQQVGQVQQQVNQIQQQVNDVAKNSYAGVAAATALTMIPGVDVGKKFAMGMGVGTFKGSTATAIGMSARLHERLVVKAGVGTSGAGTTAGVGASFQW